MQIILLFLTLSTQAKVDLTKIKLPEGFKITIAAKDVENARSMSMSTLGTLYVGTRSAGNVYALRDEDKDGVFEKKFTLAKNLYMPNGVSFHKGDLYIAEVNKIRLIKNIESRLANNLNSKVIFDKLPTIRHHGWKYINWGPDDLLYIPIGAPCNICLKEDPRFASIYTWNPKTDTFRLYSAGIRNSVGFTWHPRTKHLWFTDNGRDWMGDDKPSCELNVATRRGEHFGYPYKHAMDVQDPDYWDKHPETIKLKDPALELGAHVAPLGLKFYTRKMFPKKYRGGLFIAEHGSWNRSKKSGYRLTYVKMNRKGTKAIERETFAEGFMRDEVTHGRPVDVLVDKDGSMLVSDDYANVIYRITYKKPMKKKSKK
jgi:glucose/arabinose dehydrogenase